MFAFEFNDGCPIHVYASTSRDNLLATVLDVLQTQVSFVFSSIIMPHVRSYCLGIFDNQIQGH